MFRHLRILSLALALCFAFAVVAQAKKNGEQYPNLLGTWESAIVGHIKGHGFIAEPPGRVTIVISEQNGAAFTGTKSWKSLKGEAKSTTFSGVLDPTGKEGYVAEHDDGFGFCKQVTSTSMVYIYLESGIGGSPKALSSAMKKVK